MPAARWIQGLALAGVLLCFTVVVLGSYVRLSAAGLGCPDWPGCYGHVTPLGAAQSPESQAAYPNRPLEVGKAWREMIHRYAASTLGLIIVMIAALTIASPRPKVVGNRYAIALFAIVIFQGLLGMLTVTWQLKPLIVTLHLLFGMTTLGLLWWLLLSMPGKAWGGVSMRHTGTFSRPPGSADAINTAYWLALAGLVALIVQIGLGGWTSSNYAAVACPDVPTCQNSWWPQTDYKDAFVLWRGLGINYEGGVLNHPARVAIHLTHRIGALIAALTLCIACLTIWVRPALAKFRVAATFVLAALALQLTIGISMVLEAFPRWLATSHNAGAALLLLATLGLLRVLRSAAAGRSF